MTPAAPRQPGAAAQAAAAATAAPRQRRRRLRLAGGGGGCALPYWGKYVYHDNNRDINLSQMQMRAIADWYFTAHPPIMHDLHESLSLLYTYSGGAPQNPNLDPLLFAELPFFSNWELSQMTKWGMPGVYTHAFMDGWSPGYLGSVAYNHNGMMRMYETQSGRDGGPAAPAAAAVRRRTRRSVAEAAAARRRGRCGRWRGGGRRRTPVRDAGAGGAAAAGAGAGRLRRLARGGDAARRRRPGAAPGRRRRRGRRAAAAGGGRGGAPTGRGGGQDREWYRGIPVPPGMPANFTRRNNTNYMQTGVLSALQLTSMFPNLVLENFYVKTRNSIEQGKNTAPHGYVIPAQRDMTRPAELVRILRAQGIEVGQTTAEFKIGETDVRRRLVRRSRAASRTGASRRTCSRSRTSRSGARTYDDSGWTMGFAFNVDVKEIRDKAILDVAAPLVKTADAKGDGSPATATARHRRRALRLEQHDRVPLPAEERADEGRREELHGRRASSSRPARSSSTRPDRRLGRQVRDGASSSSASPAAAFGDGADGADARRRRAARRDLLAVERHAGARLVPARVRPVRHSVRPDLQGAGQEGQSEGRLRRDRHGGAEHQPRSGAGAAGGAAECRT